MAKRRVKQAAGFVVGVVSDSIVALVVALGVGFFFLLIFAFGGK